MFFSQPARFHHGHHMKLQKKSSRTDIRKFFFSNRVVNSWNALPAEVVESSTVEAFKRKLRFLPIGEEE